ncbi:MAG: hypothetical protein L0Y54_09580 [Sporichthyaceae bacterium]|nr:hypothetical protein [Sporichthyaceae bacterium]
MPAAAHRLAAAEQRYLDARDLVDELELGQARGLVAPDLEARASQAIVALASELAELDAADYQPANHEDRRALELIRGWLAEAPLGRRDDDPTSHAEPDHGYRALSERIEQRYSAEQAAVDVGGDRLTRLAVLGRLAVEPDAAERRRLFLALDPVWRSIDGDGAGPTTSPYQRLLRLSADRWASGRSPVAANARALGLDPATIEPSLVEILQAWRAAMSPAQPIEPWDWWYQAGAADRALGPAIPVGRLRPLSDPYHAALGADPHALGIGYDVDPRPDRPPVPVAYTTFGRRPREGSDGGWTRAQPWILGTYTRGGLGELTELVHETGHGIHLAGIRTRPAFADWPDSDAFTEALGELTALDTAEPSWQQHWLGTSVPLVESLRGRYAEVMLDVCWALFEIRLHVDPARRPNDVWTELTSTYLGIAGHPEWSWWAMRGQLVQEPGYMVNYAIGPILAADLRAAIRAARGDWTAGDPGWYAWVSERIYRWGLERTSGEVLRDVLGRPPTPDALLTEIARA